MAVKIRLKRMGKIRSPFYRVVVMDSRTKRDGRAIEEIGKYHPTEDPSVIDINGERAQYWLGQGAQPTEAVEALLKVTGDWQKFKGEPGAEGTLKVKEPKPSKKELYEAAVAAAGKSDAGADGATTARKRAAKKAEDAPAQAATASQTSSDAEASKADAPKAEAATADQAQAENPENVAAIEEAVEQDVIREEEAERSITSEKGDDAAKGEGS